MVGPAERVLTAISSPYYTGEPAAIHGWTRRAGPEHHSIPFPWVAPMVIHRLDPQWRVFTICGILLYMTRPAGQTLNNPW